LGPAVGLLSPELARAHEYEKGLDFFWKLSWNHYHDPKITAEEVAPNGSEVIFKAVVRNTPRPADSGIAAKEADLTIRVAKETVGGKWSMRFVRIKERELEEK
jgi:hypothetical protein